MLAAKRQDGGLFKSPPYPGYPFIMIPDLTSPYLPNGSLSPTARTVSSFLLFPAGFVHTLLTHSHTVPATVGIVTVNRSEPSFTTSPEVYSSTAACACSLRALFAKYDRKNKGETGNKKGDENALKIAGNMHFAA